MSDDYYGDIIRQRSPQEAAALFADNLRKKDREFDSLYAGLEAARAGRRKAEALLHDIASSAVEFEDPRVHYVTVQIDVEIWRAVKDAAMKEEGG